MEAPPVQYARTSDGFDIAYAVSGAGRPFVMLPNLCVDLVGSWRLPSHRHLYEQLSRRYRLIRVERRGTGLSTRGNDAHFDLNDNLLDIEAVATRLGLSTFALYGGPVSSAASLLYAAEHPDKVEAVVTWGAPLRQEGHKQLWELDEERLRASMELFAIARAPYFAPLEPLSPFVELFCNWMTREHLITTLHWMDKFELRAVLPRVQAPTLVLGRPGGGNAGTAGEGYHEMASLLPNGRLFMTESPGSGLFTNDGSTPPAVRAIEQFLAEIPPRSSVPVAPLTPEASMALLSAREIEVLRLIANAESNKQIAQRLSLSLNTVNHHVSNIYAKIEAPNRAAATAFAVRHGLT